MSVRWLLVAVLAAAAPDWKQAVPDFEWSFPRDHWAHEGYRTEWWYLTGHLESITEPSRRFGYQFTLFRIGVLREPPDLDSDWAASHVIMGHVALTDLGSGRHLFSEVLYREVPLLAHFNDYPEPRIGWSRGPAGTGEIWTMDWNGDGFDISAKDDRQQFGFRLDTRAAKPVVLQGPNGFSRKGDAPGAASQYYSYTRLRTTGEVELDGARYRVTGLSWMDKEISSSQLTDDQVGWDWFSLQLDDGRDLMLYLMRAKDGSVDHAHGTLVDRDGETTNLSRQDFSVEATDHWTSPETRARYPSRWRIRIGREDREIDVRALAADQENRSRLPGGVHYWEGAVSVSGDASGVGFVELTGYGEGNRPPV